MGKSPFDSLSRPNSRSSMILAAYISSTSGNNHAGGRPLYTWNAAQTKVRWIRSSKREHKIMRCIGCRSEQCAVEYFESPTDLRAVHHNRWGQRSQWRFDRCIKTSYNGDNVLQRRVLKPLLADSDSEATSKLAPVDRYINIEEGTRSFPGFLLHQLPPSSFHFSNAEYQRHFFPR